MEQIFGKGVSKGVAAGPISFYRRASGVIPRHEVSDTAAELERFRAARETAKEQLAKLYDKALAEAGEDAAMLFEAHQMMLDDLDFVESIEGMIENDRVNAEAAVSDTGAQFAEMFAAMDDSYMQARAADIRDISARVIGILTGEGESGIVSDVPCIVTADDLAPSETVQLDKALILGFITAGGSANSHTAILARTMGIPAIIGAGAAGTQAPGESFPERTIAGIGKDMTSRIDLLNGQADAARTGVESKMSTYIALYAADDDSLTASVEDYRYYLDELASLTQLAAVAATDAEYRRCLEQLLRSFLTIKRAIDTDASDIHDQLDRINAMLKGQQFGPKHGSLSLHADVRRPERTFWAQLIRVIGTLNDWKSADVNDSDASRKAFAACAPMVGLLRAELAQGKDANGVKSYGARNLDPRCRSSFYAIVHHADGPDERITSTGGRSGGALQELTSFVYGAALIYLLGGGLTSEPSYTTLFLDEALIKADGRYTQRALTVLPRLGFQVIVSAPESKTGEILEVSTKAYVTYKDPDTGLTSLREAVLYQNDMDDESSSDILKDDGVAE